MTIKTFVINSATSLGTLVPKLCIVKSVFISYVVSKTVTKSNPSGTSILILYEH